MKFINTYGPGGLVGACQFQKKLKSYIKIPNSVNGLLDVKKSITVLVYMNNELNYPGTDTGTLISYSGPSPRKLTYLNYLSFQYGNFFVPSHLSISFETRAQNFNYNRNAHLKLKSPVNNNWKFVGFSYNMTTGVLSFWEDGNLLITASSLNQKHELATQYDLRIGVLFDNANKVNFDKTFFQGKMSCLQIYDRELSVEEVREASKTCNKYQ